jgi:hypothetical protein
VEEEDTPSGFSNSTLLFSLLTSVLDNKFKIPQFQHYQQRAKPSIFRPKKAKPKWQVSASSMKLFILIYFSKSTLGNFTTAQCLINLP